MVANSFDFLWLPIEYNPKLSDATPVTRLAYIKFMKPALRREQIAEDAEDGGEAARGASGAAGAAGATAGLSVEKKQDVQKSILRVAKVSTAFQEPQSGIFSVIYCNQAFESGKMQL